MLLFAVTLLFNVVLLVECCSPAQIPLDYFQDSVSHESTTSQSTLQSDPLDMILKAEHSEYETLNETITENVEPEARSNNSDVLSPLLVSPTRLIFTTKSEQSSSFKLIPRKTIEKRIIFHSENDEWTRAFPILPNLYNALFVPNFLRQSSMEWIPKRSRILASFIDRATLKLSLAPPVSWTFCEPLCGVGDQAVDAESAFENAQEDVREAVMAAFKREGIAMTDEKRTVLVYDTNSVLLDEFGDFFDHSGMRYHAENGVVVGRIDANRPKDILSYFVALEAKVSSDYAFGENIWRRLANDVLLHLIAHKQTRFRDTIAIIF